MKSICVSLLFITSSLFAQSVPAPVDSNKIIVPDNIEFTFTPAAFYSFGETEYEFELTQTFVDTAGDFVDLTTRSLLEFPLDVFLFGGSLAMYSPGAAKSFWSIELGIYANVTDPSKAMKDSDWLTLEKYFPETMISYTESGAEMNMLLANIEAVKELIDFGGGGICLLVGYRYQKIEQTAIGYEGWFLDTNDVRQPISGTAPAIDYRVTYKGPQFGLLTKIVLSQALHLSLKTAGALARVDDFDDHLLRKFHTFADGNGIGFVSDLKLHWNSGLKVGGHPAFFDFTGNFDYYNAELSQTFEQYADGGPYERPVGYRTGGLPHKIRSHQFRTGIRFAIAF
ncbi:MAG: hypothetical protein ACREBV_00980 [Candidatus Zixiibacteriota bacterium]